jgi:hypothetical protein
MFESQSSSSSPSQPSPPFRRSVWKELFAALVLILVLLASFGRVALGSTEWSTEMGTFHCYGMDDCDCSGLLSNLTMVEELNFGNISSTSGSPPKSLAEANALLKFGKEHCSDKEGDGPKGDGPDVRHGGVRPDSGPKTKYRIARALNTINDSAELDVAEFEIDPMIVCPHCAARLFPGERNKQKGLKGFFGVCCQNGDIKFDKRNAAPPEFQELLKGTNPKETELYMTHSRQYNMSLAMASFSCHNATLPSVLSDFRVQGQTFVRIGGMKAATDADAKFFQVLLKLA